MWMAAQLASLCAWVAVASADRSQWEKANQMDFAKCAQTLSMKPCPRTPQAVRDGFLWHKKPSRTVPCYTVRDGFLCHKKPSRTAGNSWANLRNPSL